MFIPPTPGATAAPAAAAKLSAVLLLLALLNVATAAWATAPNAATVTGRVLDPSGAVIPGATVTLRRPAVGLEVDTRTDELGRFRITGLFPGEYEITAAAKDFSPDTEPLTVSGTGEVSADLTLRPGAFREEITVMDSRLSPSPEAASRIPGSLDVLDAETLENARVFNFSEALRKLPGINVRDEEGFGLRPNIGLRGLNPTRSSKLLLLEDGIPLAYAPYGDNASYYHPPIERFTSIEVLKGSGQIVYGPVTVGGVVNYITPEAPRRFGGHAYLEGGNRSYVNGSLTAGGTWKGFGLLADYTRKQGDGARENIRSGLNDVNFKASRSLGDRHTLAFKFNYYGEDSNITYSGLRQDEWEADPRQNPFRNDFFDGNRYGTSLNHTYAVNSNVLLATNLYASHFSRDWWRQSSNSGQRPNDASDPACGGMENLNTTCGNEGRLRDYYTYGLEPRLKITHRLFGLQNETDFGFRVHFETQKRIQENGPLPWSRSGVRVEFNERRNTALSWFAQNRFVAGKFAVTPGVRIERIYYQRTNRLTGVMGETEMTQVVPGIGVAYSPTQRFTVFAGAHRGFAPPRTEDVISNSTGGVVELDPELSWNYELGFRGLPHRGLRLEATWFRMDYENQIVPASLAGGVGATLTNGGETLQQGLELLTRVDTGILRGSRHNLYFRVAYTWVPTAEFRGARFSSVKGFETVSVTGNRLPYAPEHLLNAAVGYSHPSGVDFFVEAVRIGGQFGDDLNTVAPTPDGQRGLLPGNTTWNATLNYGVESLHSTFFISVKNLLDSTFIVDRSRGILPNSPRLVQAGLKYRF